MNEHDNHDEDEGCEEEDCEDCDEEEDAELVAEFQAHVEKVQARIQKHVDAAEKALEKACELADEEGVSFYSGVSFLGQNYSVPANGKFADLEQDTVDEITGTYNEYGNDGWQHSAVC